MATATKTRKVTFSRTLREEVAGYDALPAGGFRVDRTRKIVFGMKMVGLSSPNTHGVPGAVGTDYELAALRESLPLYEGSQAFMDHPEKRDATAERKGRDSVGIWHNARITPEGTFGDLHLVPSHPMTEAILDVAEKDTLQGVYMASHNADGQGVLDPTSKRYRVKKITEVRSVDIVTRGATTRNFRESQENRPVKKKLQAVVLESKLPAKLKAKLLELDVMDTDMEEPGEGADDWKQHLVNAVGVLVKSEDPEDHKKAKAILKQLEPAAELEEEEEPEKKPGEKKEPDKEEKKAALEESRELFKLVGFKPSDRLLESVASMPKLSDRLAFVNELKASGAGNDKNKPPPGAPRGGGNAALLEGQEKRTYADLAKTSLL